MDLAFLMIVLMQPAQGPMSAAFVNTQTLEDCEARAAIVRTILESEDYTVEQAVCRASAARFEPFAHGVDPDAERYAYSISFTDADASVEAVTACESAGGAADGHYCATSTQKLLP